MSINEDEYADIPNGAFIDRMEGREDEHSEDGDVETGDDEEGQQEGMDEDAQETTDSE